MCVRRRDILYETRLRFLNKKKKSKKNNVGKMPSFQQGYSGFEFIACCWGYDVVEPTFLQLIYKRL